MKGHLALFTFLSLTIDEVTAIPFWKQANAFSRKSMTKVLKGLRTKNSDLAMEYKKSMAEQKAIFRDSPEDSKDVSGCPDELHKANIELAFASGQRRKPNDIYEAASPTHLLNDVHFYYHINGGLCGTIIAGTDLQRVDIGWREPDYVDESSVGEDGPFDISKLKLSAGDALKRAKLLGPATKHGLDRKELKFNMLVLNIMPWFKNKKEPVYMFIGVNGEDDT